MCWKGPGRALFFWLTSPRATARMPHMKTLLIWEEIPENTRLFLIEESPPWITRLHGKLINSNAEGYELERLLEVSDAICERRDQCMLPDSPMSTTWAKNELDPNEVNEIEGVMQVVVCGIVL